VPAYKKSVNSRFFTQLYVKNSRWKFEDIVNESRGYNICEKGCNIKIHEEATYQELSGLKKK